jgi:hypothetical protein
MFLPPRLLNDDLWPYKMNISSLAVTNRKQVTSLHKLHPQHRHSESHIFVSTTAERLCKTVYHRRTRIRGIRCWGGDGLYVVRFPPTPQSEDRLCCTQPPVQWVRKDSFYRVMRQEHEADHRPSYSAEIKNSEATSPLPTCINGTVLLN